MGLAAKLAAKGIGNLYAAAHHHHVDVVGRALKEDVAHISAHNIAVEGQLVGSVADKMEYVFVEYLCQFGVRI